MLLLTSLVASKRAALLMVLQAPHPPPPSLLFSRARWRCQAIVSHCQLFPGGWLHQFLPTRCPSLFSGQMSHKSDLLVWRGEGREGQLPPSSPPPPRPPLPLSTGLVMSLYVHGESQMCPDAHHENQFLGRVQGWKNVFVKFASREMLYIFWIRILV